MPARKPRALKALAGTLRPDRDHAEPEAQPVKRPRCPVDLPEAARPYWRRLARVLGDAGLLTKGDVVALADLALTLARLAAAEAEISKYGLLLEGRQGGLVKNPLLAVVKEYRMAAWRGLSKFGLTPSDRKAVPAPAAKVDALETLLAGLMAGQEAHRPMPAPHLPAPDDEEEVTHAS